MSFLIPYDRWVVQSPMTEGAIRQRILANIEESSSSLWWLSYKATFPWHGYFGHATNRGFWIVQRTSVRHPYKPFIEISLQPRQGETALIISLLPIGAVALPICILGLLLLPLEIHTWGPSQDFFCILAVIHIFSFLAYRSERKTIFSWLESILAGDLVEKA